MQEYFSSLAEKFIDSIPNFVSAVLILIISYYFGVWLSGLSKRVLQRQNAEASVSQLLTQILKWTIICFGVVAALQKFFNVTAFLTGLGILGFTIGFALQNIMANFVSGVILLIQNPFRVGHNVNIANFDGTVLKIGLRTTEIQALDGRLIFLPNADVLAQPIINYTRAHLRRVEMPVSVANDADLGLVREVILEEIKKVKGYIELPEPQVLFSGFDATSMTLNIFFWVDTSIASQPAAKDEALTGIKSAFEKNDIVVPYPYPMPYLSVGGKQTTKRGKTKK